MAIVGEPCNVDAGANILALFMIMLGPLLCVHMYSVTYSVSHIVLFSYAYSSVDRRACLNLT